MEHSKELEELLLAGLPEQERKHVVQAMNQETAEKLAHIRGQDDEAGEVGADVTADD